MPPPFFLKGGDGIRAWSVTGVQTCALPISPAADTIEWLLHPEPAGAATRSYRLPVDLNHGKRNLTRVEIIVGDRKSVVEGKSEAVADRRDSRIAIGDIGSQRSAVWKADITT